MNSASEAIASQTGFGKLMRGLGRAVAGALLFGLPMLMTMELWQFGFSMDRWRLLLLLLLALPLLVGVVHRLGFEDTFDWREDLRDTCVGLGIGMVTTATVLTLFNTLGAGMSAYEIVGKIAVLSVPAALGALLARSQLGEDDPAEGDGQALSGYFGTLFLMLVGALYFGLNIAPTDEIMVIAHSMTPWHSAATLLLSLALMHGFVFAVGFRGGAERAPGTPAGSGFLGYTLPGYVLALAISLYLLWTFGRVDGLGAFPILMATIVLAFPAAIGAAAARLIL